MTVTRSAKVRSGAVLSATLICIACWVFMLNGAGTGMNVWAMTSWHFPPGAGQPHMMMQWSGAYALLMLGMWWTMMLAMMLPGVIVRALQTSPIRTFTHRFFIDYALVWLVASVMATLMQFVFERSGWVHSMSMWAVDQTFTLTILALAGLSQIHQLARLLQRKEDRQTTQPTNGYKYGWSCIIATGPMMALMFVGGIMNMVWIVGLCIWAIAHKQWGDTLWPPAIGLMACFSLFVLQILHLG